MNTQITVAITEYVQTDVQKHYSYRFNGGIELHIATVEQQTDEYSALEAYASVRCRWTLLYEGMFNANISGVYRHILDNENTYDNLAECCARHVADNVRLMTEKMDLLGEWLQERNA